MSSFRRRQGFTLVELLVVVGTIAVLIGILLPALNKARAVAQMTVCESNLRQLGVGYLMYCDQNKGLLPTKGPDGSDSAANAFAPSGGVAGIDDPSLWFNGVLKALGRKTYYDLLVDDQNGTPLPAPGGNAGIFVCPSSSSIGTISTGEASDVLSDDRQFFLLYGKDSAGKLNPITAGGKTPLFKYSMAYVANASLTNTFANTQSFSTIKISRLRPASQVVMMAEKIMTPGEYKDRAVQDFLKSPAGATLYNNLANAQGFISNVAQPKTNWKRFTTRHNGGGNILFADGHVAYFKWRETQVQPDQLLLVGAGTHDANQYSRIIWSVAGPIH